ncbi:MAG: LPP20 family lipoprotein, partial [Candidatus Omnitrophica bacterium]|nr:LPP20 family lipoprotein [Candidatus Omnitrophota bacterium]
MRIFKCMVLFIIGAFVFSSLAFAQTEPQKKLLARRAALVDAYRNLAEKVRGLRIDSQTYVRDFVVEFDQIRTDLDTFLRGAEVVRATYLPDGTCEVEVEMPLKRIVVELKRIKKQYAYAGRWKVIYFDKIYEYYTNVNVRAKGSGVPREERTAAIPRAVTTSPPGWENVTPRGRLMAERAALVDAYRNLSERVNGLRIDSQTYVRDFVAESDQIRTDLDAWIKGVEPISPYRYLSDGICEVDVEISVRHIVEELIKIRRRIRYWQHVRYKTIELKKIIELSPVEIVRATGSGVPPAKYMTKNVVSESLPRWASRGVVATGVGVPPEDVRGTEARLMAARAAKIDALRNLAERVYGVKIDAITTIRD